MIEDLSWRCVEVLVVSPTPTHPQDHGNRKRIFEICRALKRRGAKLHFVHYPAEHDWRNDWPSRYENMMREAWDSYHLVAPTRPLHSAAIGSDHEIDEWADPALAGFLTWACSRRRFDVAIVNYTWMSFALEAIPSSVYKVLDTHDVFGSRRALLEANNIAPEFFHTTTDEERVGLARADLVWAIKESERVYFERDLGVRDSLTMLHAEPQRDWWAGPVSKDGWLRAGVIGARNNINRRNLEEFLNAALPIFSKYMAPVKIVIAGGCSEDFKQWDHPNVEIMGRVPEVEDFYRSIDLVLTPMRFSTGLKIKVSEALASNAPVLSHAHAMEGYPTRFPLHQLESFEAIALELANLAFDPGPLKGIAARSRSVCDEIQTRVDDAIDATRLRLTKRIAGKICIVTPIEALNPRSILQDNLEASIEYIRHTAHIEIFLTGRPTDFTTELLERFGLQQSVFVDSKLYAKIPSPPDLWMPFELTELLDTRGYARAYFLADCSKALRFGTGALKQVFVRYDAIEISGGNPDKLIDLLNGWVETFVISGPPAFPSCSKGKAGAIKTIRVPFRRMGRFKRFATTSFNEQKYELAVLGSPNDLIVTALVALGERLGVTTRVLDLSDTATFDAIVLAPALKDPLAGLGQVRILVQVAPASSLSSAVCEAAMREGVLCVSVARGDAALGLARFPSVIWPESLQKLLSLVASTIAGGNINPLISEAARNAEAHISGDSGWTRLWRVLTTRGELPNSNPSNAVKALFGGTDVLIAGAITSAKHINHETGFERVALNQHLLLDKYTHLDLTVLNLSNGAMRWPIVRFKVAIYEDVPHLEFRRREDWPDVLSQDVVFKGDGGGDVLQLNFDSLAKIFEERKGSDDAFLLTTIVERLAAIVKAAIAETSISVADETTWLETIVSINSTVTKAVAYP